jgi:hypothetical protein
MMAAEDGYADTSQDFQARKTGLQGKSRWKDLCVNLWRNERQPHLDNQCGAKGAMPADAVPLGDRSLEAFSYQWKQSTLK